MGSALSTEQSPQVAISGKGKQNASSSRRRRSSMFSWRSRRSLVSRRSFRGRMMEKHENDDVYKYYKVVKVAGEGSISTIQVVQRKPPGMSWAICCCKRRIDNDNTAQRKLVARDLNSRNFDKLYALKTIHKNEVNDFVIEEMRNEIRILKHMDHPNIVKVFEIYELKRKLFLVMEYFNGGDLYERMPYTEADAAKIVQKILGAVAYLHKNKVVHRDLKLENILFESKEPNAEIKLIDFGLSKIIRKGQTVTTPQLVGTVYTMSPQVLEGVYTSQADLWAIGVITYMLLSGTKPFWGNNLQAIEKIMRCEYDFKGEKWENITTEAKGFIKSLLQLEPSDRPTAEEAMKDPWFSLNQQQIHPASENNPEGVAANVDHQQQLKEINRCVINYAKSTKLKKFALMVIAHKSSLEDIMKLREVFGRYDTDYDGMITFSEFRQALFNESDYTEEEIKSIFDGLDVNETGVIDFTEFIAATLETQGRIENERLAEAFDRFDLDNTGSITKENLREVLGSHYDEEMINQIVDEIDVDRNGEISYDEFLDIFRVKRTSERNAAFRSSMVELNRDDIETLISREESTRSKVGSTRSKIGTDNQIV